MKKSPEYYLERGRPSTYKIEYSYALWDYVDEAVAYTTNEKTGKIEVKDFPTLEDFADKNGLIAETITEWAKKTNEDGTPRFPELTGAWRALRQKQKNILSQNGLRGLYRENFAIFVGQNFTDMRQKIEHSGDQDKPIAVKVVDYSNADPKQPGNNPSI